MNHLARWLTIVLTAYLIMIQPLFFLESHIKNISHDHALEYSHMLLKKIQEKKYLTKEDYEMYLHQIDSTRQKYTIHMEFTRFYTDASLEQEDYSLMTYHDELIERLYKEGSIEFYAGEYLTICLKNQNDINISVGGEVS